MGWIKVEQSLITHHKTYALADALNISTAEAVGILVGLWTWALDNVDENGTLPDMSNRMMQRISGSSEDGILPALVETGFIDEYVGGYRIHNWDEYGGAYQSEKRKIQDHMAMMRGAKKDKSLTKNSYKEDSKNSCKELLKDTAQDGLDKIRLDKIRKDKNNIVIGHTESKTQTEKGVSATIKLTKEGREFIDDIQFQILWDEYPRKQGKANARKAWLKLKEGDELIDQMLFDEMREAIRKQKESSQWKDDGGKYIPYLSTWLNGRRWEDEVTATTSDTTKESGSFQTDDFFSKATERAKRMMNGGKVGDAV